MRQSVRDNAKMKIPLEDAHQHRESRCPLGETLSNVSMITKLSKKSRITKFGTPVSSFAKLLEERAVGYLLV